MAWTKTHDQLQRVLNQLEDLDAGVVAFRVADLPEPIAAQWLESESERLRRLVKAMGDQFAGPVREFEGSNKRADTHKKSTACGRSSSFPSQGPRRTLRVITPR